MKIIDKKTIHSTENGDFTILLEDWSEDYPTVHAYADQLAAYPIAKGSVYKGYYNYAYPRRGEKFRLGMKFTSTVQAQKAMNALEDGTKTLKDFVNTFDTTPNLTRKQICECL